MKKLLKSIAAVALAAAMGFSLAGCSIGNLLSFGKFDAAEFMKGQLDVIYHGVYNEYFMETCGTTEKELEDVYNDGINAEADSFADIFQIENPTDDVKSRVRSLCRQMYDKADYTVVSAEKQSDGSHSVKITIRPLDFADKLLEAMPKFDEDFAKQFEDTDLEAMTEEEYGNWYKETAEPVYAAGIVELLGSLIENIEYQEEQEIVVQLEKDSDGLYRLSEEDLGKIGAVVLSSAAE